MKVKFRNNHLIFRTSVEEMIRVILEVAQRDGEQEEAIEILKNRGWTDETIKKFDDMWREASEDMDPFNVRSTNGLYKMAKNNIDLSKFWCMK
jgi:hypothetical protein